MSSGVENFRKQCGCRDVHGVIKPLPDHHLNNHTESKPQGPDRSPEIPRVGIFPEIDSLDLTDSKEDFALSTSETPISNSALPRGFDSGTVYPLYYAGKDRQPIDPYLPEAGARIDHPLSDFRTRVELPEVCLPEGGKSIIDLEGLKIISEENVRALREIDELLKPAKKA